MTRVLCLVFALTFSTLSCHGRWSANAPVLIYGRNEAESFERTVQVLKAHNYEITESDAARGHIKAWAKTERLPTDDGKPLKRASWFIFQIDSEGDVRITTHGYHVRENNKLRKNDIDQELRELEAALKQAFDTSAAPAPATTATPQPVVSGR